MLFLQALSESWKRKDFIVKIYVGRENLQRIKAEGTDSSVVDEVSVSRL